MSLADLVQINISASSATPSEPGFGTILIAAQKVPGTFTSRTKLYSSLTEMTDDGFAVSDPAYLCAQKMKAQNPSIESWKVGKRANKLTQVIELTCTSAVEDDVYSIDVGATTYTYTVPNGASTTTVATALAALIDAHADVSAAAVAAKITVTHGTAGELLNYSAWTDNLKFQDATNDPGSTTGLAQDLADIYAYDTDWYGLALDSASQEEIEVAALWTESNKKLFVPNSSDWGCSDAGTSTDVMSVLETAAYARTGVLFSRRELLSYSGPAWMAKQFTQDPGSDTWKFKTLAGISADTLSAAEESAIRSKHGNFYSTISGINMTQEGWSAAGEWLDTTRFVDWLKARLQFLVFSALVNAKKIAYTDAGIDLIGAIIDSGLDQGVAAGGLAPGTTSVTVPLRSAVASVDRAARKLSGVTFTGELAGAIHSLEIDGSITA